MSRRFAVIAPGKAAWVTLLLLGGVLPLVVLGVVLASSVGTAARASSWLPALPGALVVGLVLAIVVLALRRLSVVIEGDTLVLRAAFSTQRVPLAELDLDNARIGPLDRGSDDWPRFRSNGYGLPGAAIGHFRGRPLRHKLFCILTDRNRVLRLPQRDGARTLVLSLEHPQRLLDALKRVA